MLKNLTTGHLLVFAILVLLIICGILGSLLFININESRDINKLLAKHQNEVPIEKPIPDKIISDSPHKEQIVVLESEAGMMLSRLTRLIIRDEGKRKTPYLDKKGNVTIGVGRSLATNGISIEEILAIIPEPDFRVILNNMDVRNGRIYIKTLQNANRIFVNPLTAHDIELLLIDDLKNTTKEAVSVFGNFWNEIDEPRKEAIIDTMFNLGLPNFKEFEQFIGHVRVSEWTQAGNSLLLSQAARDNIIRYNRNASVIITGNPQFFELE